MEGITPAERTIVERLAEAWNLFNDLPQMHPDDRREFVTAIHQAQLIIAMRTAQRVNPDVWPIK